MPVDNELYNRLGDTWWDENEALSLLGTVLNPVRFGYFRAVLLEQLKRGPRGQEALDVGCGGGLLAEEFARLGCQVTGIDPSEPSLVTARAHAQQNGLSITYQVGTGEHLPFADASFDIVYCCDVLEHVRDLEQVITEIARVLKTDGIFFYDTINRTLQSKIIIKFMQDWKVTRFMPANLHDWNMYIRPRELTTIMKRHQLEGREMKGISPSMKNPLAMLRAIRKLKRGKASFVKTGKQFKLQQSNDLSHSYMGYAVKATK